MSERVTIPGGVWTDIAPLLVVAAELQKGTHTIICDIPGARIDIRETIPPNITDGMDCVPREGCTIMLNSLQNTKRVWLFNPVQANFVVYSHGNNRVVWYDEANHVHWVSTAYQLKVGESIAALPPASTLLAFTAPVSSTTESGKVFTIYDAKETFKSTRGVIVTFDTGQVATLNAKKDNYTFSWDGTTWWYVDNIKGKGGIV